MVTLHVLLPVPETEPHPFQLEKELPPAVAGAVKAIAVPEVIFDLV
jgi:hypothetical protein